MELLLTASVLFLLSLILPAFASENGDDFDMDENKRIEDYKEKLRAREQIRHQERITRLQAEQRANEQLRAQLENEKGTRQDLLDLEEEMTAAALELAAAELELALATEKDEKSKTKLAGEIRKLKKDTEIYNRELAKSKKFADSAASSFAGMLGIQNDLVGGITSFISMNDGLKGSFSALTDEMSKTISAGSIFTSILAKITEATVAVAISQDQAISSFRRTTGAFSDEYVAGIEQTFMANRNLGVSMEEAAEASAALFQNMASFSRLQQSVRDELTNTVTLLNEIGVSANTSTRAFDVLNRVYNVSADNVSEVSREITDFAMNIGLSVTRVLDDLAATAPGLSQWGEHSIEVFMDLERVSKSTGIAIQGLVGIAKQFDTFEGAAEAAGRLNAMLGGPYMNSIELLNAEEGERISMLRQSISLSGKNFNSLGRFERQAIAAAAGISSMEEANRLFGMSNAEYEESIRLAEQNSMEQERLRELSREAQTIFDNMKAAFQSLAISIGPVINVISGFFARLADGLSFITENLGGFGTAVTFLIGTVGLLAAPIMLFVSAKKAMALQAAQVNALLSIQTNLMNQQIAAQMASVGPTQVLTNTHIALGRAIASGNQNQINSALANYNAATAKARNLVATGALSSSELINAGNAARANATRALQTAGIDQDTISKARNAAVTGTLSSATGVLTVAMQGLNKALGPIMILFSVGTAIATIIGMFNKRSSPKFTEYLGIAADETNRWSQSNRDVIPTLNAVGTAMNKIRPQVAQAARVDPNQVMTGTTVGITPMLKSMARAIPTLAATVSVEGDNAFESNRVLKASVAKLDVVRDDNRQVVNMLEKMLQSNERNSSRLEAIANRDVTLTINDREFGRATKNVIDREMRTALSSV